EQLNLAAFLFYDDYTIIVPPLTPLIPGVATDDVGIVGVAMKCPLNTPVLIGDTQSLVRNFGDIGAGGTLGSLVPNLPTTNPHPADLVTEAIGALKQGANNLWCVRVSD